MGIIPDIPKIEETTLSLLVDYCKKTTGTIGANGYEEIVLYLNNEINRYELHTFQKYEFMKDEEHHVFLSSKEDYDLVMKLIRELNLESYENNKGFGLCGGDYVCKFKSGDRIVRITTENLLKEGPKVLISVGSLMRSLIKEQSEISN